MLDARLISDAGMVCGLAPDDVLEVFAVPSYMPGC